MIDFQILWLCSSSNSSQSWNWLWRKAPHEGTYSTFLQSRICKCKCKCKCKYEYEYFSNSLSPPSSLTLFYRFLAITVFPKPWRLFNFHTISCTTRRILRLCIVFSPILSTWSRTSCFNGEICCWVEIWWCSYSNSSHCRWKYSPIWTIRRSTNWEKWIKTRHYLLYNHLSRG